MFVIDVNLLSQFGVKGDCLYLLGPIPCTWLPVQIYFQCLSFGPEVYDRTKQPSLVLMQAEVGVRICLPF